MPKPSPSLLRVEVEAVDGGRCAARVGGEAVPVRTVEIEV